MTNITLPPEALEKAEDVVRFALHLKHPDPEKVARAVCLALIEAWPGMQKHTVQVPDDSDEVRYTLKTVGIILPLQENSNERE